MKRTVIEKGDEAFTVDSNANNINVYYSPAQSAAWAMAAAGGFGGALLADLLALLW